jgi:hypothetical protein
MPDSTKMCTLATSTLPFTAQVCVLRSLKVNGLKFILVPQISKTYNIYFIKCFVRVF